MATVNEPTYTWCRDPQGYFEYTAPQMSSAWNNQRQYRINGGSWYEAAGHYGLASGLKVVESSLSPEHIRVNYQTNLETWLAADFDPAKISGVTKEPFARHCYVRDYCPNTTGRVPGLCIPDPNHPRWSWLPPRYRRLLVHVAGSPDWLINRKNQAAKLVEIKCPQDNVIYPDVVATKRARKSHYCQMQANCGILGAQECDYYLWTPNQALVMTIPFNQSYFRGCLLTVLKLIERDIAPVVQPGNFGLPAELSQQYWAYHEPQ